MAKQKNRPIITHTEILVHAIHGIEAEIEKFANFVDDIPQAKSFIEEQTAKLEALKEMYRFETGTEYV